MRGKKKYKDGGEELHCGRRERGTEDDGDVLIGKGEKTTDKEKVRNGRRGIEKKERKEKYGEERGYGRKVNVVEEEMKGNA